MQYAAQSGGASRGHLNHMLKAFVFRIDVNFLLVTFPTYKVVHKTAHQYMNINAKEIV